jgi:CheY-like chemotaxis protein
MPDHRQHFCTAVVMKVEEMLVICADDDPDDRELICNSISRIDARYKTLHATDGQQVLSMLDELKHEGKLPCLIIMDLRMPKLDGEETLQRIRSDHYAATVPVVLFTGTPANFPHLAKQYKVNVVSKPSDFHQIQSLIKRFLPYCD